MDHTVAIFKNVIGICPLDGIVELKPDQFAHDYCSAVTRRYVALDEVIRILKSEGSNELTGKYPDAARLISLAGGYNDAAKLLSERFEAKWMYEVIK